MVAQVHGCDLRRRLPKAGVRFSRTTRLATTSFSVSRAPSTAPEPLLVFFQRLDLPQRYKRRRSLVAPLHVGKEVRCRGVRIARGPSVARIFAASLMDFGE